MIMGVGVYLYQDLDWIKWLPSAVLLPFEGDFNSQVSMELRQRFRANRMSDRQVQEILSHRIADPVLHSKLKYPPGVPIVTSFQYHYRDVFHFVGPATASLGDYKLYVDDDEVTSASSRDLGVDPTYFLRVLQRDHKIWFPPLEQGKHQITLDADFYFRWSQRKSREILYTRHCRLSRDIEVQGDVLDDVSMIGTVAEAELVKITCKANILSSTAGRYYLTLRTDRSSPLPWPVAGQILVRRAQDAGFVPLGYIFLNGTKVRYAGKRISGLPGIEQAPWLEVRVVPDPIVAFLHHADACFDGVLIWERVPVSADGPSIPQVPLWRIPRIPLSQVVLNQTVGPNH